MSVSDQSGITRHAELPTLRLYLGGASEELRVVPVELSMLTIGRRPYNDLPLDDLTVSGEHALLRRRNGEFVIYDLNSRNGTLVNGLPIQHRVLADGDVIDIGIYRLLFEASTATSAAPPPAGIGDSKVLESAGTDGAAPTVERRSGKRRGADRRVAERRVSERRSTAQTGDAPPGESSPSFSVVPGFDLASGSASVPDVLPAGAADADPGVRLASIEHLNGPQAGQRQLLERTINRIGGAAAQVAVISRRKGGFFITHLEGLTFPQVNGDLIGLNAHQLSDGDLIELAGAMLRFRLGS